METLHPGARGGDVVFLFQKLAERGLKFDQTEAQANWYGPTTVGTLHDFQVKHGLKVDDVVGPDTWDALERAGDETLPAAPDFSTDGLSVFARRVLVLARQEYLRPVIEQPLGSNRGARVDDYLRGVDDDAAYLLTTPGPPWCARFAKWCIDSAARQLQVQSPVKGWGDLASSYKWLARGRAGGRFSTIPAAASVGCILTDGNGHVVVVARVLDLGRLMTIEGNSGNRVSLRSTRTTSEFVGFIHVAP